jgi:hypothetical protein
MSSSRHIVVLASEEQEQQRGNTTTTVDQDELQLENLYHGANRNSRNVSNTVAILPRVKPQ